MIDALHRTFPVDQVELSWDRWGEADGVPLLLCHGFSGSAHDFALQVEPLSSRVGVVALDHRGHGSSTKLGRLDGYSIDRIAADLIALIDTEVGGPVHLLGHSMGGAVSLKVTLQRPDLVASLVLMDTSGWSFRPDDEAMASMMAAFMEAFDPSRGLPDLTGMPNAERPLIEASTPADWQARKAVMDAAFDPYAFAALGRDLFAATHDEQRARLGEITCPVTVIVGEHDQPFVGQAPTLAAAVADGRVNVIPGAYHSPQLTHPDEWTAALLGHLAVAAGAA